MALLSSQRPREVVDGTSTRPARRDPLERVERALNSLGATIIGSLDELVERGGDDLLRRVRTAQGHLATVERALAGASSLRADHARP